MKLLLSAIVQQLVLSLHGDSLLMLILPLGAGTVWKWAVLPTFQRNILTPSSALDQHYNVIRNCAIGNCAQTT
jgi:hypothetical protein